jgi:hypothetical protein
MLSYMLCFSSIAQQRKWCFWWTTSICVSNSDCVHSDNFKQTWDYGNGVECSESNSSNSRYVSQQNTKYPMDCLVTQNFLALTHKFQSEVQSYSETLDVCGLLEWHWFLSLRFWQEEVKNIKEDFKLLLSSRTVYFASFKILNFEQYHQI